MATAVTLFSEHLEQIECHQWSNDKILESRAKFTWIAFGDLQILTNLCMTQH